MWIRLSATGTAGSEGGVVIADEEYKNSCRITLEKCEKYYAITCGVYGAMVHTAFTDSNHYKEMYEEMKIELQGFIDRDCPEGEETEFYESFCSRH